MLTSKRVAVAWYVSLAIALGSWFASVGWSLLSIVTGGIVFAWGVVVASNWHGIADFLPKTTGVGRFQVKTTVAVTRLVFGVLALWGGGVLAVSFVALTGS